MSYLYEKFYNQIGEYISEGFDIGDIIMLYREYGKKIDKEIEHMAEFMNSNELPVVEQSRASVFSEWSESGHLSGF